MLTRLIPRLAVCGLLFTGLSACSDMDMPNLPAVQAASLQSLQMGDFDAGLGSNYFDKEVIRLAMRLPAAVPPAEKTNPKGPNAK